ncbi:DUF7117 family protein [Halovenus salina]|uniref:TFIIB-type zinc ribbon-containing protein n=1 Tax=Halovenus salina TaxID=1510225 RepID=A0ABD5W1P6_9EURY
MELRGERECQSCGTKWSYYETGEITCPACGSIRSVGLDEPTAHTAGAAELDLTDIRNEVGDVSIETLADDAAEAARTYLRSVGFVDAGELQPLSDTVLAASELRRVGATLGRVMRVDEDEELYLLELLRLADQNDRPAPDEVLETLAPERGLGVAAAVDIYLRDLVGSTRTATRMPTECCPPFAHAGNESRRWMATSTPPKQKGSSGLPET